jgi:hypothetical protein
MDWHGMIWRVVTLGGIVEGGDCVKPVLKMPMIVRNNLTSAPGKEEATCYSCPSGQSYVCGFHRDSLRRIVADLCAMKGTGVKLFC